MDVKTPQDKMIAAHLAQAKTIALVGASPKPARPSHQVMTYLLAQSYTVIPVNPGMAGETILGQHCYASLTEIPYKIDLVDIFRQSEACLPLAHDAITIQATCFWMQLSVKNAAAKQLAQQAGLYVVEDKCTKIEHHRLVRQR